MRSPGGTCESQNAERGTEVKCGPCAIITVRAGRLYSLDWWTGLDSPKNLQNQCRTEAKHTYLFTKFACIRVFPRIGRGQRSRAYLISFSKMRFVDDRGILFSMLQQKAGVRCLM